MIVLNNVAVGDTYSDATTVLSLSIENVSLFVYNNPVTLQIFKKNPGGGQGYELLPEQNMSPGSAQFPGAVGLRIKNAVAGQVARVILVAPEFDPQSPDPGMVGYVPTTLTLGASGSIGVSALSSYSKSNALIDITTPSGNIETDLMNVNIRAADINSNSQFVFYMDCDYSDAAVDANFTLRAYLGATKILDTGATAMGFGGGVIAGRNPSFFIGRLAMRAALNSQIFSLGSFGSRGNTAYVTGTGVWTAGNYVGFSGLATPAVNMAVDTVFRITGFWSVNDANHSFRCYSSLMTLF